MAGFDDLIEHLLNSVALAGDRGLNAAQFQQAVRSFYDEKAASRTTPINQDEVDILFSDLAPETQTIVDDDMIQAAFKWLVGHPEISVMLVGDSVSKEDSKTDADQVAPAVRTALSGKRLFTTLDRIWHAVAGHGVDHSRLPKHDFQLLQVIASHGPSGVLQPVVTKITGQDKRSVPHRTDRLAQNGYIAKEAVVGAGTRTSVLRLARYTSQGNQTDMPANQPGLRGATRPVLYHERWYNSVIQLLKDNNNIMSISDIWLGLGIAAQKSRHQKQQLARCLRRVAEVGLMRRVRAQLLDRDGKVITTNSSGQERSAQAIQLLREPAELDRLVWLKDSALKPRTTFREEDVEDDIDEALLADEADIEGEGDNDVVVQVPPANITQPVDDGDDDDEIDDLDLIKDRVPPIWRPELPLPNLIHEVVDSTGEAGITLSKLAQRTTGLAWRRPMDEVTNHLTDAWQHSQPPHLRHLGLTRSAVSAKSSHYRYRTIENYQKVSQSSKAETQFEQDSWGFPKIPLKELAGRDGRATLAEGRKGAVVEGMRTDDDHMVVQESAEQQTPISRAASKQKPKKVTPHRNSSNKSATATSAGVTASLVKRKGGPPKKKPPIPGTSKMRLAPNTAIQDLPRTLVQHSSGDMAEEVMVVDEATIATSEVLTPTRFPRGPYGMRERLSSTIVPDALLESTPETEITTKESTPQPPSAVKRKNSRRSLPGQPNVPIVRIHEIKEEEYEAFDKWAQMIAERRVKLEVMSARRNPAPEAESNPLEATKSLPFLESGTQADVDMTSAADLPQDRVATMKAQILARNEPGVYMNPPGARKMKAESFISRGRPRHALIAVIKSKRLHELGWFQPDDTPRFAPMATKRKTARVGSRPEISNELVDSDSEADQPARKRQRAQTSATFNAGNNPYANASEVRPPQQATRLPSLPMPELPGQSSGPFEFPQEQSTPATDVNSATAAEPAKATIPQFRFVQAGFDGAADEMSPSDASRAHVASSAQATDTMQDVSAAKKRLKQFYSKPGRKSKAALTEMAQLQKQLAEAEAVNSTTLEMQAVTVQMPQDRPSAPPSAQYSHDLVHQNALPVSRSNQESLVVTSDADAAAIELAKLQSTPGRKSAAVLQRMAILEQKVKEAKEVKASVEEAALTSELQKLCDQPGRKTPEMLARMAAIVQALQHSNVDGSASGRDPANPPTNVGGTPSISSAAPTQTQPSEKQSNSTSQGILNVLSTPEVPLRDENEVLQAHSTKRQSFNPYTQSSGSSGKHGARELYDTAYVDAHPEENFYHVGRGRWAKGFPPAGTTQKTAVRGPPARTGPLVDPNIYTPTSLSANDSEEDLDSGLVVKLPIVWAPSQRSENVSLQQPMPSSSKVEIDQSATYQQEELTAAMSAPMDVDQDLQTGDPNTFGLELVKDPATPLISANSRPGGAAAEERRKTVLDAIRRCNGVFPGDHELWYVCTTAWRKSHNGQTPARITTERTIQQLMSDGSLKKFKFTVEAKNGAKMVKHVLAEPHIEASSELLLDMQRQMTLAYPKLHLPLEVEVSPEMRAEVTKKQRLEKNDLSNSARHVDSIVAGETQQASDDEESLGGPITVQQSVAAAAIDDQKAQRKGFANAEALRLHTQQLYRQRQFSGPGKRRKRRRSEMSSDEEDTDDDDDDLLYVHSGQQEMQDEMQLDGYEHDLSSSLLPSDGLEQLRQAREQEKGAFKPKSRAQQPARNLRRPLGSLRTTRANPRRKWWEDSTHIRDPAAALLMNPTQLFHASTGTFSTNSEAPNAAQSGSRVLRERTLAREDAAWEHLSSQDWAEVVQRANGLQPVSTNVFQSTISDVVKLKVPGDRLAEIVSEPPRPGAGMDDSEDEEARTRTESVNETPPPETTPKRRYKSRKKKARIDQDDLAESDEEFVPGASSPKEDVVLGTPGRVRMPRGGKDMITRDRHSGAAFKDADKLVIAIALVAAVCGGINQDRLNWSLVAHALSFRYEGEFLRRRWSHYVRFRKADVDALRAAILEPFLEAYEKNDLPTVNFQDLGNTDWPSLFRWVQEKIPLVKHATISEVPSLPPTRKALQENYNFHESSKLVDQDMDVFFKPIADMKRRELAVAYVHGVPMPGEIRPDDGRHESMLLAKSWLRAVAMTKQANYNPEKAARKIAALGAKALESAAIDLLDSHILSQEKKGRQLPGRNYVIHGDVIGQFRRWPSSQHDEHGHLKAVAQSWLKINEYFKTQDHMQLLPVASDPDYLVLTNMCAQGFLRVKPILPEPTVDLCAEGPRLSAWGYGGKGYETKKVDPSVLKYDLVYTKMSGYKYEPELNPNVPVPLASAVVPGERGPRIPLWVDIHGNLIGDAWSMVLRSLLHLLVYRPGAKAFHMQVAHEHKLWAWEIEMALDWMEKAGLAKRCGSGKEVDGVWKGGWRASEWWYCAFLPAMIKWDDGTE